MSIDTGPIGRVAAELMDELPQEGDGEIIAVGLVVVYDEGDGEVYTRVKAHPNHRFEMLGLFEEAIHVTKYGEGVDE